MIAQLPLLGLPSDVDRGTPLLAVWLDGEPQRAKHHPQVMAGGRRLKRDDGVWVRLDQVRATTRPDPAWKAWRDEMVRELKRAIESGEFNQPGFCCPVLACVTAVFARPKNPRKTYTMDGVVRPYPAPWTRERVVFVGRPDADQVEKAALDVLVQAGLLLDDPLVVGRVGGISRWYSAVGEDPHVEVRLWRA